MENTPDSPPGVLQPAPKLRAAELYTQKHSKKVGVPVIPIHRAVLSQRLDSNTLPAKLHPGNRAAQSILKREMDQRLACFWATHCGRGCSIKANYQSTTVHLPPALASGNLDIITDAMVHAVDVNDAGKATGVRFFDKKTGEEHKAEGRIVVLAASSGETVRILLNSRNARFPTGVANSSGLVGKYLMDTVGAGLGGQVPALESMPPHNEDGAGGSHAYSPWWLYQEQHAGKLDFPRGYHIEMGGSRGAPGVGTFNGLEHYTKGSYGRRFKEDARRYYGSFVWYAGRGEMIPNEDCYCELDPEVKDKWGLPVTRFHWKWSDYELKQALHMQRTFASMIEAMGGSVSGSVAEKGIDAIKQGGEIIHEVGGAIMGADQSNSVCNQYCQTWDVPNLFLTDGSPFCSNADKNPTLTIMALAWRAADYMISEMKKGAL